MEPTSQDSRGFTIVDHCLTNSPLAHCYYRILVKPSSEIKYLAYPAPNDIRSREPRTDLEFTTVPPGEWKVGHLRETPKGTWKLDRLDPHDIPGISPAWHHTSVDASTFPTDRSTPNLEEGHPHGQLFSTTLRDWRGHAEVVVNKHWAPHLVGHLARDTFAYSKLQGHGLAREFLAHVTEGSRVIGYVVAKVNGRWAGPEDAERCVEALARVHALSVAVGYIGERLFFVTDGGEVLLMSFPIAYGTGDPEVFEGEIREVRASLGSSTAQGQSTLE